MKVTKIKTIFIYILMIKDIINIILIVSLFKF